MLALKEADLGIAIGTWTASARAVSQPVLRNDNFAVLPSVIAEGRRVLANIERTGDLFLTKTSYVLLMALAVGVAGAEFSFLPRHLSIVAGLTIGMPAFFLALAPNTTRSRPGFVGRVLRFSVPAGCIASGARLAVYSLTRYFPPGKSVWHGRLPLQLLACELYIVARLVRASEQWQRVLLAKIAVVLVLAVAVPELRAFFALEFPPLKVSTL